MIGYVVRTTVLFVFMVMSYNETGWSLFHFLTADGVDIYIRIFFGVLCVMIWIVVGMMIWKNIKFLGVVVVSLIFIPLVLMLNQHAAWLLTNLYANYFIVSVILGVAMMWPKIRQGITGMRSTDDVDDE